MKSTIEELADALDNMPQEEFDALIKDDNLKAAFLIKYEWTLEEFEKAVTDMFDEIDDN